MSNLQFAVGDKVAWDEAMRPGPHGMKRLFGDGPFLVAEVKPRDTETMKTYPTAHPQMVTVQREDQATKEFSGDWFIKVNQ